MLSICIVFFKQKTAYEMRISDWSSDVCSSDLKVACQALWKKLVEAGDIYLGSYSGWYAVRDEAYYAESELTDGPKGTKIAPSGAECEWGEEESYFFKLSEWGDRLLAFYDAHPAFLLPATRSNEVDSFVKGGLKDLQIRRTDRKSTRLNSR